MKTFAYRLPLFMLLAVLFLSFALFATNERIEIVPVEKSTFQLILIAILAIYEVIVRLIPSIGNYSLIAWIIDLLKKLSDLLNRQKRIPEKSSDLFQR